MAEGIRGQRRRGNSWATTLGHEGFCKKEGHRDRKSRHGGLSPRRELLPKRRISQEDWKQILGKPWTQELPILHKCPGPPLPRRLKRALPLEVSNFN